MKVLATLCAAAAVIGAADARAFKELVVESKAREFLQVELLPELMNSATHYSNPAGGCESDEVAVRIQGVKGAVCSPKCDGMECPSDVPDGCEAQPQCMLQDASSGNKYCALACTKGTNCGDGASCKILFPGIGLCTYD